MSGLGGLRWLVFGALRFRLDLIFDCFVLVGFPLCLWCGFGVSLFGLGCFLGVMPFVWVLGLPVGLLSLGFWVYLVLGWVAFVAVVWFRVSWVIYSLQFGLVSFWVYVVWCRCVLPDVVCLDGLV